MAMKASYIYHQQRIHGVKREAFIYCYY
ncbi:hypothetical protein NC652_010785 [Populus alba x Populus x berolinensis]|nr:hypothetical protein NC652_010785 [Populus alba x Populus x berolinensis]